MNSLENINEICNSFPIIKVKKIQPLEFSSENINKLREELSIKGYAYIRYPIIKEKVENARKLIEEFLVEKKYLDEKLKKTSDKGILLSGYRPITHHSTFLNLVEGKEIKHIMSCILKQEAETLETKWIRILGNGEYTSTHADYYKFYDRSKEMYTCWLPLKNQGLQEGTICVCEESHLLGIENENIIANYELPESFLKLLENGSKWVYSDFQIGDLLIFNIKTIHCSFRNDSQEFRMNCDTRWIPRKK